MDVRLRERVFIVGPNASGKSNLLDLFRFLRDIAKPGGGLQQAVVDRGGISQIRCLAARKYPDIEISIELATDVELDPEWKYELGMTQQTRGERKPLLRYERVSHKGQNVLYRPDELDKKDPLRLTQTHLEQINSNAGFRDVARFLERVVYLHLVPQLVRHPREYSGPGLAGDPFGRSFLERIGQTPERSRNARLRTIERALKVAVPQLTNLSYAVDSTEGGVPHLEAVYEHWRPFAGKQRERDFSDGTLRLIGLMWSLLEADSLLLLEEPELSLHSAIVSQLAPLIYRMQRRRNRQVLVSTHSAELLNDRGIDASEVLLLAPGKDGTKVSIASSVSEVVKLLEGGLSIADAVLPRTRPANALQLSLFE